jgi:CRP-like cAMP-binding protein
VQTQHIVANRILRQLSPDELQSIEPWLSPIRLEPNVVLLAPGGEIEQVYFPLSGMVSLLSIMSSGEAVETGIVGADGVVGGDAPINGHVFGQTTVQIAGDAVMLPKARFVDAYHAHPRLRNLVNRYQSVLLAQAQQNAACHALHSVRSRLLPMDAAIARHDRQPHVQPDPGIFVAHARRAPEHRFNRGP